MALANTLANALADAPRLSRFAFALLTSLAGCKGTSERQLVDTERRHFYAKCQSTGECDLKQTSGDKRTGNKTALSLLRGGRLVGICDVTAAGGAGPDSPGDCRALVCQSDADCPPAHGLKDGQCLNALCADPAQPLIPADSVMLCLAGSGLGNEQARQIERYALGLNCGTPCKVPAPCRQP
ncbi:MAG TPA: hypothetical protein VFK05_18215 [Polyangiaceae bacterium]|nr:hypothetical protein [Polyangiaceae bacterium]